MKMSGELNKDRGNRRYRYRNELNSVNNQRIQYTISDVESRGDKIMNPLKAVGRNVAG